MIREEILDRYQVGNRDRYESEYDFYMTFLAQTDHIPNKIIEAQVLGKSVEDYTEILEYRQLARDEINRLSN